MKEIDFLPNWYTAGRKKKVNYRRQYFAVGMLLFVMLVWSFVCTYSLSISKGQVHILQRSLQNNGPIAARYSTFENELANLRQQKTIIEELQQKTRFSCILAELSNMIDYSIAVEDIGVEAIQIKKQQPQDQNQVRLTGATQQKQQNLNNDRKLKVTIRGTGEQPSNIAQLISKLEASDYFCNIIPGFSRNKEINGNSVTEFEIVCYVADYIEEGQ